MFEKIKNIKIKDIPQKILAFVCIINFIYLLGDSFGIFDKFEAEKEYSNGDTRIERYSESSYDTSGWSGHQEQWEEVYYDGKWITREEYNQIMEEAEYRAMEYVEYTDVYFINNGYYYHMNLSCKGLEGYSDLNKITLLETQDYPNLKPCNWCAD